VFWHLPCIYLLAGENGLPNKTRIADKEEVGFRDQGSWLLSPPGGFR
jgi:hypothetical protein